jgi:predicted nucleotidyltransferase
MFAELLGSKSRAAIVARLVVAPDHQSHLRELVRAAGGSVSSVQREVERLVDMGLVRTWLDESGRRQVALVTEHPFADPLSGLVAADARAQYGARSLAIPNLDPRIAQVLEGWVDAIVTSFHPLEIVLFGSQARGNADSGSDVDLLVVLPQVDDGRRMATAIMGAIGPRTVGVDVIAVDSAHRRIEMTRMASVVRDATEEGTVLYERSA